MKEELNINHIKPYLGTKLKALYGNPPNLEYKEVEIIGLVHREFETHPTRILADNMDSEHIWMFKPLLHPLSRLTEPILEGGKIPLEVIALFGKPDHELIDVEISNCGEQINYYISSGHVGHRNSTEFDINTKCFRRHGQIMQHDVNQKLFEWHFDIFGLIEKGLAEPIETSKANEKRG